MSQTVVSPELADSGVSSDGWMVLIYNNDTNGMDEVMFILMEATGCTAEEAYIEMWEAHTYGKASVHYAGKETCDEVARIISSIGVQTQVVREWPE
jgi:ATP-dependent Clp protease adaptor protein ClpS